MYDSHFAHADKSDRSAELLRYRRAQDSERVKYHMVRPTLEDLDRLVHSHVNVLMAKGLAKGTQHVSRAYTVEEAFESSPSRTYTVGTRFTVVCHLECREQAAHFWRCSTNQSPAKRRLPLREKFRLESSRR